jgi:nitrite reductase/ring-hydroxylating ferredoxin subunit
VRIIGVVRVVRDGCRRCPHKGTLLDGLPGDEGVVICPAHGLSFDLVTGCVTSRRRRLPIVDKSNLRISQS